MDRNTLAQILSGGGRGDPYANQASGPFATSPRITQHGGNGGGAKPAPAKAASGKPKAKASGSKSASRSKPKGGGQYNMPVPTPRPDFNPMQNAIDTAPTGPGIGQTFAGGDRMPQPIMGPGPGGGTLAGQAPLGGPGGGTMTGQAPLGGPGGGTMTGQPMQQPVPPHMLTPPSRGPQYPPGSFADTMNSFDRSLGAPAAQGGQGAPMPPGGGGGFWNWLTGGGQ